MLLLSTFLQNQGLVSVFISQLHLSPFYKTVDKFSSLIYACMMNDFSMVRLLLHFEYKNEFGEPLNLSEKINKIGGRDKNTCLHYAAKNNNREIFNLLVEKGADQLKQNYFDLIPLDLATDPYFLEQHEKYYCSLENQKILEIIGDPRNEDTFNQELIQFVNENFSYVLVANSTEEDYRQTLIYEQLSNLKKRFKNLSNFLFDISQPERDQTDLGLSENIDFRYIRPQNF